MDADDREEFLYTFFPFMFGIYPYTSVTEKQKQAMDIAHVDYPRYSVYEITKMFAEKDAPDLRGNRKLNSAEKANRKCRTRINIFL